MAFPAVTFNFAAWVAAYPEFVNADPVQAQFWFDSATDVFANDTCNPAWTGDTPRFTRLFWTLTAHIGWLSAPRDANGQPAASGQPASPIVGRISSASEGSVSVSAEWNGSGSPSEAWFLQTKYGAQFWQATAQFRTARYVAQPTYVAGGRGYPPGGFLRRRW